MKLGVATYCSYLWEAIVSYIHSTSASFPANTGGSLYKYLTESHIHDWRIKHFAPENGCSWKLDDQALAPEAVSFRNPPQSVLAEMGMAGDDGQVGVYMVAKNTENNLNESSNKEFKGLYNLHP